ncbi:MAG: hypothetical protein AAF357_11620, partial [Verrucomicrobiota bacterium]
VQLLPITVDMLFWKRGTCAGAIAGLSVGLITAFSFTSLFPLVMGEDSAAVALINRLRSWLPVHAAAWGVIPNTLVFVIVSSLPDRRDSF